MPIKEPERYPADWALIAWKIKCAANWCCEACGVQCRTGKQPKEGEKPAIMDEQPELYAGFINPVLTVHHLDWKPENNAPWNLAALCAACHLVMHREKGWHPLYPQPTPLFSAADDPWYAGWWWRRKREYQREYQRHTEINTEGNADANDNDASA